MITKRRIEQLLTEELSKQEVRGIVDGRISSMLRDKEFDSRVREIAADILEKFFRMMYNRSGVWKNSVKNGN